MIPEQAAGRPTARGPLPISVVLYLSALTVLVRLPFFFRDVINWDESTFILVGQSLLDGHLPYTETWEIKPPLAFAAFAAFIGLFGKSVVSVRLGGAICVAASACFVYLAGRAASSHRTGILAATLFVLLVSLVPAGQATLTEHVAIVPLTAALALLVMRDPTPRILLFAGILLGTAALVRLNLAYVSVFVGLWVVVVKPRRPLALVVGRSLAFVFGGGLVVLITFLPYALSHQAQTWWASVVEAHWSYASAQHSVGGALARHAASVWRTLSDFGGSRFALTALVWLGGLAGGALVVRRWPRTPPTRRRALGLVGWFLLATAVSVLRSGASREHYLIQLLPLLALPAGLLLDVLLATRARFVTPGVLALCLVVSLRPIGREYVRLAARLRNDGPLVHGTAQRIAAHLEERGAADERIYLMTDHLAYWLLDAKPLGKITHPSNITRPYLLEYMIGPGATPEGEMARILASEPRYIVAKKRIWYLARTPEVRKMLRRDLRRHYVLEREIRDRQIYRRRD